jgi:hypothetical protein
MTVNNAEDGIDNALINELRSLRREFDEFKSTPQPIGNGSMNWATFEPFSFGPVTIASGAIANFVVTFMPSILDFIYDGKFAIKRITDLNPTVTLYVDNHTAPYASPFGASLTTPLLKVILIAPYSDYLNTGVTETNGQHYVVYRVKNEDTVSHDIYLDGSAIIPRPALKPL